MRESAFHPFAEYLDRLEPTERLGEPLVACHVGESFVSLRKADSSGQLWLVQKRGSDESFWRIDPTDRVFVRRGLEVSYYVVAGGLLTEVAAAAVMLVTGEEQSVVTASSFGDAWIAPVRAALAGKVSVHWMDSQGREVESITLPPLASMVRSNGPTGYGRL